jgi:AcrR family transcriptional regulator
MAEGQQVPPIVARMWGRDSVSQHGPRPSLDLAAITAAAIGIADREGLAGVRMSSVAARLGVATMSLYRYVDSKSDLLTAMVDAAAPEPPELEGRPWRDYLTRWTRANRDFLLERAWLLQIPRSTPPLGPRALLWLDRVLAALAPTGLDPGQRINIATLLNGYAVSQAGLTLSLSPANAATNSEALTGGGHYGAVLAAVLDDKRLPALAAAVRGNAFGDSAIWVDDSDFTFGLELLLDGIEALIARR